MTTGEFFERVKEATGGQFADLGLLVGHPEAEVRSIAVGVEVASEEIKRMALLREKGEGPDLLLSHHFSQLGSGKVDIRKVAERQEETLCTAGVPEHKARKLALELAAQKEIETKMRDDEPLRLAKKLGLSLGIVHTPADIFAERNLREILDTGRPQTLAELVKVLTPIPEFREAERRGERLTITLSSPAEKVEGIFYCISIGWTPLPEAFEELARAGRVKTILTTSATASVTEACHQAGLNLVELPHYGTDSLGLNLLLDAVLPQEVKLLPCPDFIRAER